MTASAGAPGFRGSSSMSARRAASADPSGSIPRASSKTRPSSGQTPVMLLHNDGDDAVPWYQGVEFYLALRRLGKEVYLFDYNGEPHGLRKRPNQKDYTIRLQEYFDHYLKGAPAPAWMEKGVPYLERERTELSTMSDRK